LFNILGSGFVCKQIEYDDRFPVFSCNKIELNGKMSHFQYSLIYLFIARKVISRLTATAYVAVHWKWSRSTSCPMLWRKWWWSWG